MPALLSLRLCSRKKREQHSTNQDGKRGACFLASDDLRNFKSLAVFAMPKGGWEGQL